MWPGSCALKRTAQRAGLKVSETKHEINVDAAIVTANWRKFVRAGIVLFLLTGFYNYLVVAVPQHHGDKLYHMLMGIKIVAAFGVFFLAEALVGRSAAFAGLRQGRKTWLLVLIVVAFAIVAISSLLRVRGVPA